MWLYIIKLIRWPNLLIIFITQWIVWVHLVGHFLAQHSVLPTLSLFHFIMLSICTILVAAGGYIINDIEDIKIDLINKPHKVIVGKHLTTQFCKTLYYSILSFGFIIALYLGWSLHKMPFVLLYPVFAGLLHLYATHLKKSLLLGNALISLFVASVPVLIFLAEFYKILEVHEQRLYYILILYCALAFLANLMREIVKDIQDMKGDKAYGARTFPILFGSKKSKILLSVILTMLISLVLVWTFYIDITNQGSMSINLGTTPLILTAGILIASLPKLDTPKQFGNWSNGIKLFMLFGLVFLYLQTS